ncbi:MAG TPA: NAD(P)H-dependent glycerol-3-phosphate dehydrogenase [Verrucomicrobiales bacterium]|nr:NAD(P)H-dependent glycerol-3-phosphate dehydrogenase [Verrucomicrobiales bacterium]
MNTVAILGAGSWGSALAFASAQKCDRVILWGRDEKVTAEINRHHLNHRYLPDIPLPAAITATTSLEDVKGADLVMFVVPSQSFRGVADAVAGIGLREDAIVLSCTKGIEKETGMRMTEILHQVLPVNPVAVLSGPNHAEEIGRRLAAAAVVGSSDPKSAQRLQQFFTLPWFRSYTSDDVTGIEWGGAVKNIFAIAAGISEGLGLGDNARAALVTRGLAEMARLGMAAGGRFETFQGLSGVGDLIVTCYSSHSRNNRAGNLLGKGQRLEDIVASMNMVAEGIKTSSVVMSLAQKLEVEMPIAFEVDAVVQGRHGAVQAFRGLRKRAAGAEQDSG